MRHLVARAILFTLFVFSVALYFSEDFFLDVKNYVNSLDISFENEESKVNDEPLRVTYHLEELSIKSGDNLSSILQKKMDYEEARKLIKAFSKFRKPSELAIADEFVFYIPNHNHGSVPTVVRVDWKFSNDNRLIAQKKLPLTAKEKVEEVNADSDKKDRDGVNQNDSGTLTPGDVELRWVVEEVSTPYKVSFVTFEGEIEDSLWNSGKAAGLPNSHIAGMADLFAWEIDFSREVRKGHKWKMVVEKLNYEGKKPVFGKIVATNYEMSSDRIATAVKWEGDENVRSGYFQPNGESLRRMFLKAPIDFARISSRFNRARFHPILKKRRPHLGVDYAAKIGTPVKAIGSGVVIQRSYTPTAGKTIKIKHNATYSTAYKHLNGYARNLKKGSYVEQGQVIGYVGTTGLSTGPHLHFELKKDGRIVDPLSETFPTADPFPSKYMAEFERKTAHYLSLLKKPTNISVMKKREEIKKAN